MDAVNNPRKSYPAIFASQVEHFLKAYNNKKMLSVHVLIIFTIFLVGFLVDEKIKLKYVVCSFDITVLIYFETPSSFKDPKAAILTLKMLTESCL